MESIAQHEVALPDGVTWTDIFNLRNYMATCYAQRWNDCIPREEFLSAGNLAIAELLAAPTVPGNRNTFIQWLRHQLNTRMWKVPGEEFGRDWRTGKPKDPVPPMLLDAERLTASQPDSAHASVYLQAVCAFLAAYPHPERLDSFWREVGGDSRSEIADALQITPVAVEQRVLKLRRDLWAWAGETTARAQRAPAKLTPAQQARVRDLRQQGLSIRQIARSIGRGQATVVAVLHQTGTYATAAAAD